MADYTFMLDKINIKESLSQKIGLVDSILTKQKNFIIRNSRLRESNSDFKKTGLMMYNHKKKKTKKNKNKSRHKKLTNKHNHKI